MKFRKAFSLLAISAVLLLFTTQACIKKNDPVEEDFTAGEDVGFSQSLLSNIFDAVMDVAATVADSSHKASTLLPSTVKLTYTDSVLTDGDGLEYTLTFYNIDSAALTGGSQCTDERTRAGKLLITQSGYFVDPSLLIKVTMADDATAHYVGNGADMVKFIGTLNIQRTGAEYKMTMQNGIAKFKTGKVLLQVNETITTTGNFNNGMWGQTYSTSGTFDGQNRNGDKFTSFIGITLVKKLASVCSRTYVQGQMEVKNTPKDLTATVNFDPEYNNNCDRVFKISLINGVSNTYKVN